MAKWKELGEVPDSEDESGFDSSQESEPTLPLQGSIAHISEEPAIDTSNDATPTNQKIWDIPSSSQTNGEETDFNRNSNRPSSPQARPRSITEPKTTLYHFDSSPLSSPPPNISDDHGASIQAAEAGEVELDESEIPEVAPLTSSPQYIGAMFEPRAVLDENEDILYEETPTRGGRRSLRPRKPIQEHPYLLEGAQYSSALRSHGIRPLRVHAEEGARKKPEEDSQEQEYEDESQSTLREQAREDTEGSQELQHPDLLDNLDEEEVQLESSPPRPPSVGRSETRTEELLNSSQSDNEFPDPADIDKWKKLAKKATTTKRQASPKASEKRKLPKLHRPVRSAREASPTLPADVFDIPPSPPHTSPNFLDITPVNPVSRSRLVSTLTPKPSSTTSSRAQSPAPANQSTSMIDLTMVGDEDEISDENSGNGSESDVESRRATMRRRMRGVLPASWLRLDQSSTRQKNKRVLTQRSPDRSPERTQRKGVAQRRQVSPKPGNTALFLDDSDDDDDMTLRVNEISDLHKTNNDIPIFEDDAGSVIEDDHIDYMLHGNKRASADAGGRERPRKRRKSQPSTSKGPTGQPKRQQRITGLLGRTKSTTAGSSASNHAAKNASAPKHRMTEINKRPTRPRSPPRLSILDVVEPNAPPFIRIAARTAKKRSDKGRSSPSKKHISLGTRKDNIDAISVLQDWKGGRIQPKIPSNTATKNQTNLPGPLHSISHNSIAQPPGTGSKPRPRRVVPSSRFSQPRRMIKQGSIESFISIEADPPITHTQPNPPVLQPRRNHISRAKSYHASLRPAQLETAEENIGRQAFDTRKRALDAIYRRSRRALPTSMSVALEGFVGNNVPNESYNGCTEGLSPTDGRERHEPTPPRTRLKFRKRLPPRQLDITAPQYAHANDPLPREASPISPEEVTITSESSNKLLGLGPFGTHYTQHFEVFPLDQGVFFHESTLLGSGRLVKVLNEKHRDGLQRPRGGCLFTLDEKVLRWSQWDAQTSSELGIVFDWIVDYFHSGSPDTNISTPIEATEFVLDYLQNNISFPDQDSQKHFAGRAVEILRGFAQRLEALPPQAHDKTRPLIDVLSRSLIISLQILRICQNLKHLSDAFQLEEALKKISRWTIGKLRDSELADIQSLYHNLQNRSFRERGIQNEQYSLTCWVVLIRVLEEARIPRCGFWDVVSSALSSPDLGSVSDAHTFERIWHDLFTLLPLGEFDNFGVLVSGSRHTTPLEGWNLPQRLLKRVFQLYESNPRQAPSFNDYCRGLVSRCHYLVEQWGWRKSNGIIGTIFDFFAARGLSHLRNEEAYKSPEFLEHLAGSPSLAIVPEDRCFHIFLKLLALSIKRLEDNGLTKDVRNLVARVLPNHNRQYEKEKDIHESDLAALRNHHDLLCTLFWAAPPSLRPSVQTIEKLVIPGSSHKEACLISLRAWNQLSQFVISLDEGNDAYKPFADWQKNIFQQVMEQYISAESDIQQQLSRMSKDASKNISRDMMNAVVKLNRKGAMDVLHFSMKGFLSVLRQAPMLGAASFALNHYQLEQVFTRFPFSSADFDWSSLRAALDILDYYLGRIEDFLSRGQVIGDCSWHGEDAIMLLERKIAIPLFSMSRTLARIGSDAVGIGPTTDREICIEQAISLAGRAAARLIHARLSRVLQFFSTGKYGVFQDVSKSASSPSRKYLALFLAVLIEQGVSDFKDLGGTILDLFLLELAKPYRFLGYENQLALAIKRHDDTYLKDAVIEVGNSPDYHLNRDLFGYVVATMRRTLRRAGVSEKAQLQQQFSKALRSTMDQMKLDLKSVTLDSPEHMKYIEFVRSLITVIRSQDLCPVDPYFYQISREYSPSTQDPRLQIAGILSWGLKLEEGDTKAVPGLFYLLFPNFKLALANGKLADEGAILQQGMGNAHVLSFVLGRMFPAMIRTAVQTAAGAVLLDTYISAFETLFTTSCDFKAIGREDMDGLLVLLRYTLVSIRELQTLNVFELRNEHVYTITQIMRLFNLLSPYFAAYLINEPTTQLVMKITEAMEALTGFTRTAAVYLSRLLEESRETITLDPVHLFEGIGAYWMGSALETNEQVNRFVKHMVKDIKDNWILDGSTINIQGPSRGLGHSATQSGQGTAVPRWDARELVRTLRALVQEWNYTNDTKAATATDETSRRVETTLVDYLF